LWFFTPNSLSAMLRSSGFFVVSLELRRDCSDPHPLRRLAKRVVHRLERPLGLGPLITVMAQRREQPAATQLHGGRGPAR
jgi:hypothetical protein